jgi:hypothetical protein
LSMIDEEFDVAQPTKHAEKSPDKPISGDI